MLSTIITSLCKISFSNPQQKPKIQRLAKVNPPQPKGQTPAQLLTHSPCSTEQGEIAWDGSRIVIRTGRLLTKYHCRQNRLDLGKTYVIYCQLKKTQVVRNREKHRNNAFPPLSPKQNFTPSTPDSSTCPLHSTRGRGQICRYGRSYSPAYFPCSGMVFPHGLQNFKKKKSSVWALHRLRFLQELSTCSSVGAGKICPSVREVVKKPKCILRNYIISGD